MLFLQMLFSFAFAVGFSTGNSFSATSMLGTLTVQCPNTNGGTAETSFSCRDSILEPVESDYFVGPNGVDADTVQIKAVHADNNTRTRSVRYDSKRDRTTGKINLWQASFFEKPLLADGMNRISYKLIKAGRVATEGEFSVMVYRKKTLTCPPETYVSRNSGDCHNQVTMCGKYFEENNLCR